MNKTKILNTRTWAFLNSLSLPTRYDVLHENKKVYEDNWNVKIQFLPLTEMPMEGDNDLALTVNDGKGDIVALFSPKNEQL